MLSQQIRLHLIVLIFGFTGILGKLIELPSELIVLYRTAIACLALGFLLVFGKSMVKTEGRLKLKWFFTGFIVGLHWFFFFESIKQSNVSVALVALSSTALFTSVLEPLITKRKMKLYEILFSVLIICGMVVILRFEFQYIKGISFGLISAFLASLFTVLNSKFVVKQSSVNISFYELLGGACFMLALITIISSDTLVIFPSISDTIYLMILAIVATALAFVVSISVMRKLSPFTVSLTINLEPLYGIILAVLIFGQEELMSIGFYTGFILILSTILANAVLKKRERKANFKTISD